MSTRFPLCFPLLLALACIGCGPRAAVEPPAQGAKRAQATQADTVQWEAGEDIAGKRVEIDGVMQDVPDDVAATKRKMDQVAADVTRQMDAAEAERLQRFKDPDNQP